MTDEQKKTVCKDIAASAAAIATSVVTYEVTSLLYPVVVEKLSKIATDWLEKK